MSAPPHNDTLQPGVFSGSAQTPASRPPASSRELRASKRVCFYKSGDPQFSGHRIVINSRTFKTFDALLDALSKKVPLPFGVRTITTPKGTHAVQSLDDLRDGASYVCSDQRRVKPLNLDEVNRRQVPWNTTRLTSSGRQGRRGLIRQLVKKNEVVRTTKVMNTTVAVWTPKRLVVFKNRDPTTKRTVVLQRRTAPTFEALLDYLSQMLQFPVVKLYTADGRRVEGLPALILCSGIVVAAGNEPFRLSNYNFQGSSQPSQSAISESIWPAKTQSLPQDKKKSGGSRSRSRNFSLSSERYFVDQINKSLNGSLSEDSGQKRGFMDAENNQPLESEEIEKSDFIADIEEKDHFMMPSEDDIEKSFRVNQDGSMTVEMKVRLTLKQEEMIHWTTTLSRTCANSQQRAVCSQPGYSPYSNDYSAKQAKRDSRDSKEDNTPTEKSVGLNEEGEDHCGSATSETLEKPKPAFRRLPTPGPRRVRRKEASVENIKRVSQSEVQESTVGAYSYTERTADGELTEGYCVVSRSSSSSTRPVPKPRKNSSGEAKHKKTQSSLRSSRMAEVLQLQNNGTEITETVMRIYESQGTYENYFANAPITADKTFEFKAKTKEPRNPDSTDSGPRSSSNDCDVDLTRQSTSSDSQNARKNELLSLSSGQSSPSQKISNNLSSCKNSENQAKPKSSHKGLVDPEACTKENSEGKSSGNRKTKMTPKSVKSREGTTSDTTVSDKKQKGSVPGSLKDLRNSKSPESQSHTGSEKKAVSSTESDKHRQKAKTKKKDKGGGSQKSQSPNFNFGDQKESSEKNLNLNDATRQKSPKKVNVRESNLPRDCQNVSACKTDTLRSPVKKKLLDVLPPPHFKMQKHKSMNECRKKSPKESRELSESVSMPVLQSSPSNVHQYVENWLKKIQPESVPYMDEMDPHEAETEARAKFWIGRGSAESSEIRSEPEKDSIVKECTSLEDATTERPVSRPPVQIRCEGEPVETQRIRSFCKSMPSVRIHPAEQESHFRMNKSSEALVPIQPDEHSETSQTTKVNTRSGMKPILQQLCLSIQSIRRTSSHSHLTSLEKEKSSSLPDFSSQVASVFGSPSKALLSFLSVMTLKDGVSSTSNEDPVINSGSCPEALQVMQSLEKIASIEDEEELKASLTSLQSSTSPQLKKSWRDFQERSDVEGSPPQSPRQSEQEFALEVDSEGEDQDKEHRFGIKELMDELNMSEDLRREISSLVDGEPTNSDTEKQTNTATNVASENKDATTKDNFLDPEGGFSEERASHDDTITRVEKATESEEKCREESCPPDPALLKIDRAYLGDQHSEVNDDPDSETKEDNEEDDKNIDLGEHNVNAEKDEHDKFTNREEYELDENQEAELQNNALIQEEDFRVNQEVYKSEEEEQNNDIFESENAESQHQEPDKVHCDSESHNSCDSEKLAAESPNDEHNHNISIEEDARLEALQCSVDDADPDANNDSPVEEQGDNENEDTVSKASEYDDSTAESHHSSISDQDIKQANKTKTGSCISPGSESEHELQTLEQEDVTAKQICSGEKNDEEAGEDKWSNALDSDKDFDAEPNYPAMSDKAGECSDQDKTLSGKSQESEAEQELQTLEEEKVTEEKDEESDEHEDKQKEEDVPEEEDTKTDEQEDKQSSASESDEDFDVEPEPNCPTMSDDAEKDDEADKLSSAVDTDEDFDAEPNYPAMSDQEGEHSDQDKSGFCKSQESEAEQELQTLKEENVTEEEDKKTDEHGDKQSSALESDEDFDVEPEPNCPTVLDEDDEHSDQNKSGSCKSQESEGEHELQTFKENSITERQNSSAEEKDDEADKLSSAVDTDEDFDAGPNNPAMSDQEGEDSDQDKAQSCKSQELEEEENVTEEKDEEVDDHENKQSTALDSDKEFDTEPDYPTVSDQDDELLDQDKTQSCKSQESEAEHEYQTIEQESITEKQTSSAEDKDDEADEYVDKQSKAIDSDKIIQSAHSCMPDPETKHPVRRDSCNSQDTEAYIAQSEDTEGVEEAEGCLCHPMEISQELLDFVNFALLSSALTFTYDSNGHLRIEPDKCKIRETSLVERNVDSQYVQRRLPSPNTSDLSDYRPETSDSGGDISQVSTDLFTETGEEEVERLSTYQGIMKPSSKNGKRCDKALDNSSTKTNSGAFTKHTASRSLKSVNSLASFHDSIANSTMQEPTYSNTSSSFNEDSEPVQRTVFCSEADSSEGILIDKGRWLLKENHLIRKSPPVLMGMYENVDTTSADTGQDNTSEEAPYPPCGTQPSPFAVISSSELEEMAKPPTPKCTYFNMPHSSDSDPFLDNQSTNSSKGGGDIRKCRELKVSPMDETSKTWAKKNGSLPSFASVEFKLPDGKVHPEGGLASGVVEKTARSQSISSRAAQEEESVEGLNLRCGRHCPIL
ncbi:LOW QUALITY PROTEIN: oxygen-regulated protein 1 [Colossoma macropomum]|uniref:LOW QUALITY PROTEIN: oxygen-regulated protein 1 n=1 Tax=Colossoma macropomum TaxID=42526 RepID=UPI001863A3EF|nr:LOW QUALITY PROTEIN: oxygen-regulated protein 1 [Colossoma macropomum]